MLGGHISVPSFHVKLSDYTQTNHYFRVAQVAVLLPQERLAACFCSEPLQSKIHLCTCSTSSWNIWNFETTEKARNGSICPTPICGKHRVRNAVATWESHFYTTLRSTTWHTEKSLTSLYTWKEIDNQVAFSTYIKILEKTTDNIIVIPSCTCK